ncbi:50S ribosomal protein L18 [Salsipaludibacter albus]|uniref:50S ribosomal protein L18 n=1 Tax=Salsipaludibacter albus TaxID=2849650 RepID=UPI001EE4C9EB|nr:50S ribosomal protein L18 [Salsipaludibacter albus]MBY5161578.1 50S ribosomal protein L18 [Salsipaludibacter albus]
MDAATRKRQSRRRRHQRIRKRIRGTAETPRLNVYRSNTNIYAQLIDDVAGHTLVAASSLEADVTTGDDGKVGVASQVGALVGQRALDAGITEAVFDRGGNRYAGRVRALAEAARDAGLNL